MRIFFALTWMISLAATILFVTPQLAEANDEKVSTTSQKTESEDKNSKESASKEDKKDKETDDDDDVLDEMLDDEMNAAQLNLLF
jgi:hypothetical protein